MADGALAPAVVDVPVGSLNQRPPDHAGPTGRLTSLYDVEIVNYASGGEGKRLLLDPRKAFSSLSNTLRNSLTGLTESGVWSSPTFLRELGDQLLSICTDQPRVYNGTDWTNYGTRRVVTQKLSESVMHATNATIAAPDSAWLTGVTCSVWTEQAFTSAGVLNTTLMIGFRADDGAWVTTPQPYYTALGASNEYVMARVVQDGSNFWVFYNIESSGAKIFIDCYDLHGVRLASSSTTRFWTTSPGYWDVYGSVLAGVLLAQPAAFNATPTDVGFNVKKFTQSGGVISNPTNSTFTGGSNHCMGPVAWLTNDLTGTSTYLATVNTSNRLWAYELNGSIAITKVYDVNISPTLLPENLTGWVLDNAGNRDVFLSYSQLAGPAGPPGPTFDPAKRFIRTISRTFAGVTSTVRTTQSVLQQSRAFAINGEYYAYTYYASGSGKKLPSARQVITVEETDSFIGPVEQKLSFTGGGTYGAPFPVPLSQVASGAAAVSGVNILGTDTVALVAASGLSGIADGTPVLKWTFGNATSTAHGGHILKVNSSSIPTANFQWDIVAVGPATVFYTPTTNRLGGTVVPGTFTATGTIDIVRTSRYLIGGLGTLIPLNVMTLFAPGGTIAVAGASNPGNNGTFNLIARDPLVAAIGGLPSGPYSSLWTLYSSQVDENNIAGPNIVSSANPNAWFFAGGEVFTDVDQAMTLNVSGTGHVAPTGDGNFAASNTNDNNTIETGGADAAAVLAQIFSQPLPTVTLTLDDTSTAYTINLGNVPGGFDYTYIGALISIASASHPTTNGVYQITDIIDAHNVRVVPTDGRNDQRSEIFFLAPTTPIVVIQRATDVQQQTQPTWFVTPLTGSQPQVGMFEKGLAFADWRFDGETAATVDFNSQDRFRFALSSTSNPFGTIRQVVLPFRVTNFTQVSIATVGATAIDIANVAEASTVGLKVFRSQGAGQGTGDAGKLLVPGLLATEFTLSGFAESNFNVGPEAPFIVSQATDAGAFALTPKMVYTYQAVIARTLENGDVVRSLPSPPIQVTLTGTNNFVVLGGRLVVPLDTAGAAVSKTFGLTNHPKVTYELYRSVIIDGVPSTQLHLVTDPANSNGMYTSGTGSGFTFPDSYTWNFRDELPDAGASATEVIYAGTLGQGIAPHFPAPAFTHAATWNNRRWVVGYDGAVWMSAELVEGEAPWFFPGFRYPFPPEDPAVCVVGFENYLFMLCAKSIWRIGTVELPNATLTAGSMPTPVKLPIAMGCSGFAQACTDFVAYSSSADSRQVWAITRDLANVYLSEPLSQFNNPVSGMAVDGQQRLIVAAGDSQLRVFDPVAHEWYVWKLTTTVLVLGTYQGAPTFQDTGFVNQQTASGIVDTRSVIQTPVPIDVTFSSLSFAQVRAVKRLWEAQIIGTNNGACNINAVISYPDDDPTTQTSFGPTLLTSSPLLLAINPAIEDATSFDIRIFGSYETIVTPGRCFSLEMLSCEVGLDRSQGLRKLPNGFRLAGYYSIHIP